MSKGALYGDAVTDKESVGDKRNKQAMRARFGTVFDMQNNATDSEVEKQLDKLKVNEDEDLAHYESLLDDTDQEMEEPSNERRNKTAASSEKRQPEFRKKAKNFKPRGRREEHMGLVESKLQPQVAMIWCRPPMTRSQARTVEASIERQYEEAVANGTENMSIEGTPEFNPERSCIVVACGTPAVFNWLSLTAVPRTAQELQLDLGFGMEADMRHLVGKVNRVTVLVDRKMQGTGFAPIHVRSLLKTIQCANKGISTELWKVVDKKPLRHRPEKVLLFLDIDDESFAKVIVERKGMVKVGFRAVLELRSKRDEEKGALEFV